MKIIVMGTGPFAIPSLRWLINSEHDVDLLLTRPAPTSAKQKKSFHNPMRQLAEQNQLRVWDPIDVNDAQVIQKLEDQKSDLFMVCDFGQILSADCLRAARLGGINLHGSLLPKYRGAAPVNWALYHGEVETGVTVIHMTAMLDAGPSLVQIATSIEDQETAPDLESRLAEIGVQAVQQSIAMLQDWNGSDPIGTRQDAKLATRAPRLSKEMGAINWSRSAVQIRNQIRAFQPWPGSYTNWIPQHGKPVRIIIHRAEARNESSDESPGTITTVTDESFDVVTGDGILAVYQLQPAGKRPMQAAEFLRGRNVKTGDRLAIAESQKV